MICYLAGWTSQSDPVEKSNWNCLIQLFNEVGFRFDKKIIFLIWGKISYWENSWLFFNELVLLIKRPFNHCCYCQSCHHRRWVKVRVIIPFPISKPGVNLAKTEFHHYRHNLLLAIRRPCRMQFEHVREAEIPIFMTY